MASKQQVLAVVGPTASGKTGLGIRLATQYNGEIISCDSMQIYKNMDIATAKATATEQAQVPHHLIDFLDPLESYSVADFVQDAKRVIAELSSRDKLPVIVGGTGLYVNSLLQNFNFDLVTEDSLVRETLRKRLEEEGIDTLYCELVQKDPKLCTVLHKNNTGRVLRALEVIQVTGKPMSEIQRMAADTPKPYDSLVIGIDYHDRQVLYDRINLRVDLMIENGLLLEAETFFNTYQNTKTAAQAIGYKELKPYFDGLLPLETCVETLKQKTRNYAKRQLTWFRKMENIVWIYGDDPSAGDLFVQASAAVDRWRNP